jgi:hypothetical protein
VNFGRNLLPEAVGVLALAALFLLSGVRRLDGGLAVHVSQRALVARAGPAIRLVRSARALLHEPLAKPPATRRLTACVAGRFVS